MRRKEYEGKDITVSFDLKRCVHARNCFLKLPTVFDPKQRPWVQPDNATADDVAAVVRTCPSGALAFHRETGVNETPPQINQIAVLENGPLAASGSFEIDGVETESRVTLCRCGLSKNKPYCDYSHVEAGFTATGEPSPKSPAGSEQHGGKVATLRIPDGPLKIEGNIELTTGTGRQIATLPKAFLCRCGASKNKPYCDGSHKDAGFSDPVDS
ncbi:CDGSH iron-sulfur domain-containing protein [Litoreibacter halocynthiae]|uniref:CDGSH iron-sulfur domain-containing protein n=1 Tax=Litoreibacter halocynthiae TaxID=1242689 RepID=UPI002491FF4C|nr:CDGSH iron-sulfur domain-containing protein [Litoreibacter halocynthiae]